MIENHSPGSNFIFNFNPTLINNGQHRICSHVHVLCAADLAELWAYMGAVFEGEQMRLARLECILNAFPLITPRERRLVTPLLRIRGVLV